MKPGTAYRINLWMALVNLLLIACLTPFIKDARARQSVTEIFAVNLGLFLLGAFAARTVQHLRERDARAARARAAVRSLRP